jgi:hypothetical protein
LTDSPAGQLAWIVEKFKERTDSDKVPEDAVARDRLLTNATIYWLTGTAGSSAQLYYEAVGFLPTAPAPPSLPPLPVPVGVAVYPHDILLPIRRLADRAFPNIVQWSEFDRGCPVSPKAANVRLRLRVILHPPAPAIQQIDLTIEADVPGLDQEEFQDHAERAKTSCIISGALGGAGQINLSATLAR